VTFHFCPNCGSSVFWEPSRIPEAIAVAVGCFAILLFRSPRRPSTLSIATCGQSFRTDTAAFRRVLLRAAKRKAPPGRGRPGRAFTSGSSQRGGEGGPDISSLFTRPLLYSTTWTMRRVRGSTSTVWPFTTV
jgi:hypothetical protein